MQTKSQRKQKKGMQKSSSKNQLQSIHRMSEHEMLLNATHNPQGKLRLHLFAWWRTKSTSSKFLFRCVELSGRDDATVEIFKGHRFALLSLTNQIRNCFPLEHTFRTNPSCLLKFDTLPAPPVICHLMSKESCSIVRWLNWGRQSSADCNNTEAAQTHHSISCISSLKTQLPDLCLFRFCRPPHRKSSSPPSSEPANKIFVWPALLCATQGQENERRNPSLSAHSKTCNCTRSWSHYFFKQRLLHASKEYPCAVWEWWMRHTPVRPVELVESVKWRRRIWEDARCSSVETVTGVLQRW